jgi:LysM repeat protein
MSGNTPQHSAARRRRLGTGAVLTAATLGLTAALPATAVAAQRYSVERGDTLAEIAKAHGFKGVDGWRVLFDANPKLDDPDHIVPGQKLKIPDDDADLERRELPTEPRREATTSRSATTTTAPSAPSSGVWTQLAACESGGNWAANTGNGYYGGLQFSLSSWRAVGGTGYPHQASAGTQIAMAQRLQARQGWGAWPACSAKLGLR